MDNRLYWIWLQQTLGVGSPKADPLLRALETPARIWEADDAWFREVGFNEIERKALCNKSLEPAARILKQALNNNGWVLTPDDALYPDCLREIYALPLVLYGQGEWPEWDMRPVLAVVGTREPTVYGLETAWHLAAGTAAAGMTIVSGGAIGIDAAAHQGTLDAGGCTVAVQGCGLDVDYPKRNARLRRQILERGGALISEYPPGTPAYGGNFPVRNRVLSGLAQASCVVEAPAASGALITATHAREQGRDVMAVPGPIGMAAYAGTNTLIQKGAYLVTSPADILRQYRDRFGDWLQEEAADKWPAPVWKPLEKAKSHSTRLRIARPAPDAAAKPKKRRVTEPEPPAEPCAVCPDGVSEEGRRMFAVLEEQPRPVDWLAAKTTLSPARAMAVLTELEIAGAARSYAGQQYSR